MKKIPPLSSVILAALLLFPPVMHAAASDKTPARDDVGKKSAAPPAEIQKSAFTLPTSAKDGRDPFYPKSNRLWAGTSTTNRSAAIDVALVVNGLSGPAEHRLAMINGRTLAAGEVSEINTPSGRVVVRCVEIKGQSVIVQVAGETRELKFQDR